MMLMSGIGRGEAHGFYESLGFDQTAKQAFVLSWLETERAKRR